MIISFIEPGTATGAVAYVTGKIDSRGRPRPRDPQILGFGVYLWNVERTAEVLAILRRVRPHLKIILGGPEVSYETEGQPIVALADHVITGEADLKVAEVCDGL